MCVQTVIERIFRIESTLSRVAPLADLSLEGEVLRLAPAAERSCERARSQLFAGGLPAGSGAHSRPFALTHGYYDSTK